MGNCFIRQNKMIIKVIRTNGQVLEYKSPIKVHQVLSQHADHAISDQLPAVRHLQHQADMIAGQIYYLFPISTPLPESVDEPRTSVRIKLVVTKQKLEMMLKKGGVSVGDLVSQIGKNGSLIEINDDVDHDEDDGRWKPVLESIPESNLLVSI